MLLNFYRLTGGGGGGLQKSPEEIMQAIMLNGKNKTEIMQSHGLRKSVAEMLLQEKSRPRPKS